MNPILIPVIIFAVCLGVFLPALWHFARKPGQHPRFRPKLGEVALLGVLGSAVCLAITVGLTVMIGVSDDIHGIKSATGLDFRVDGGPPLPPDDSTPTDSDDGDTKTSLLNGFGGGDDE